MVRLHRDVPGGGGGVPRVAHSRERPVGERCQSHACVRADGSAVLRPHAAHRTGPHSRYVPHHDQRHRRSHQRRRGREHRRGEARVIWWAVPAVYLAFFVVLVYRYHRRLPHLNAYSPRITGPLVSVIIPARDEAANIAACVRSVLATNYQMIEVVVVDDRSRDNTLRIVQGIALEPATAGPLTLVSGEGLPLGWFRQPDAPSPGPPPAP